MKRVKQYRVRLTEEEDALLKQKAKDLGISAADIIRLGIKRYIGNLESDRSTNLKNNSEFLKNWEQNFGRSIVQEFGERWQNNLQTAYFLTLIRYKSSVCYINGNFEVGLSVIEANDSSDKLLLETQPETLSEQKVREDICHSLAKLLGGEWKGDEWIVQTFLTGLRADLAP